MVSEAGEKIIKKNSSHIEGWGFHTAGPAHKRTGQVNSAACIPCGDENCMLCAMSFVTRHVLPHSAARNSAEILYRCG